MFSLEPAQQQQGRPYLPQGRRGMRWEGAAKVRPEQEASIRGSSEQGRPITHCIVRWLAAGQWLPM